MFANNKPFGTATAFGGSSFGSSTPFGQSSTAFGAKPATSNVFGGSSFGVSTPTTGGLFGTTSQPTGTGLFGQPSNTFGTPASTSTGTFGGFGATSTSGGLFGNTAPATQSSSGLFGGSTSAFGTPRQTFGGFGSTNTGTGLFGQSASAGTSLFGSTGFSGTTTTGTTIKFNPPTGTDTMMKGGVSTNISTRHQCITCMKEYENKSLEELRVEDYAANRKGPPGGMAFGGTTQQTGLFSSTPAASTSGFSFGNTTQSKPLFGTTGTTNAFGGTSSIFGQPAQNQNTGLFGKSVGFGATTTAAPVFSFGGTSTMGSGTSLFGQNNQQKPLFGQTTSTTGGLFGNTATTQSTGFGTTTGFGAFGATNQPSTGLFGAKPTGFGTTSTTTTNSFSFGNTNNMSGGLFGQKPAAPTFGTNTGFGTQTSGFGAFGATSTTGTGLFGQNKPTASVFGNTGNTFGTGLGNTFGSSTFPSIGGLGTNTGTGLFGNTATNKAPGFNFGNPATAAFNFGSNANTSAFNFNPTSSLMGGNDPNNTAALQQAQQQILAMTANPFGDSPLFRNPLKDGSRELEVLKPTNPSAQKALLNDNQFKVTLLPTAKIKPKPWSPSPSGKTFLFDGLEDEEPSLGSAAFLPKRSVKKLVLKNLGANRSTVTLTSDISGASNQSTRIDVSISLNKSDKTANKIITETSPTPVPLTVDISDTSMRNLHDDSGVASSTTARVLDGSRSPSEGSISVSEAGLGMDDSIAALHTNRLGIRRACNISNDTEEIAGSKDLSVRSLSEDSNTLPDSTDNTGIVLKRPGYYTIPPLNQLGSLTDENGNCYVEEFVVGREGYGSVTFPGKINIAGLNLDEIVHFHPKEIDVYPDDSKKPPVGKELNREAIITLENVWPVDKTSHKPIKDPERLKKMGYREKIEKSTLKIDAQFINYVPETGSWVFKVDHFSKYGLLEDSDEEMDVTKPPETNKAKVPPPPGPNSLSGQAPPALNLQPKQLLKRKPISSNAIEDDEMSDMSFTMQGQKQFIFSEGDDFVNEVYSPTRSMFSAHIDAERIQGMKASFFQQDMDEDNWGATQFQPLPDSSFGIRKENDMKSFASKFGSNKLNISSSSLNKKQRYLDHEDLTFMSPTPPMKLVDAGIQSSLSSLSLSAKQSEWLSKFPLVESIPQQPHIIEKQVHILNKIRLKSFKTSSLWNKHHLHADAGYFMGRSFRPGWRFDGTLVTVQPPSDFIHFNESSSSFFSFGDTTSFANKNKNSGFTLTLNDIKINTLAENEERIKKNLIETLQLQLENSVSTIEGDSPLFVPNPGVELLHAHAKLFESHLKNSDLDADTSFAKQCICVWNLLVALWGKVRGLDEDQDVSNYVVQMARREAVSSWLIKSSESNVTKAIASINQDNYLSKIFIYLSCLRISDAVKLAQQHQDFRLSLLLSQAEGTAIVRKWLCNQLLNWEQNGAYKFIKDERILLYAVLAGLLLWENVHGTVNCCKNLNWKQALALHLWYHCEPNASIQDAVAEYDKSFQGDKKYSLKPYPSYINSLDMDVEMTDDKATEHETVYDTCYHLLKLYCDRAYRLDQLLIPETYTTDHLDYRLSWLLHLALSSVGFNIPVDLSCTLHMNFASELESINMWHWAIFVYLHHPDSEMRMKNVKDVLLRHVSLDISEKNEEKEKFLKKHLYVPEKWIFEAKAIKAHSLGKHAEEAWFLLKAGSWNKSHSIVINYLASDAVINEDFDYLKKYLCEMALPERCCTISDWASGGQVYLDYINMNEMIKGVLGREISAYELEKITPEVLSLCSRLSSIPTPTIKDRVCVAEMAKKTATIMRSIAILQVERSKNKSSLITLASYFKNLPMPHDYAVTENRFIAHEFLKEVTSDIQVSY